MCKQELEREFSLNEKPNNDIEALKKERKERLNKIKKDKKAQRQYDNYVQERITWKDFVFSLVVALMIVTGILVFPLFLGALIIKNLDNKAINAIEDEYYEKIKAAKAENRNKIASIKEDKKLKLKKIKEVRDEKYRSYDVTKPVLLLDEHTAALDPKTAEKVLETTDRIVKEQNLTTIMITHNMKDAIKYGNRLIMMSKGRVVADISGEEKQKLTIEKLLDMFVTNSKNDMLADSAIFGD